MKRSRPRLPGNGRFTEKLYASYLITGTWTVPPLSLVRTFDSRGQTYLVMTLETGDEGGHGILVEPFFFLYPCLSGCRVSRKLNHVQHIVRRYDSTRNRRDHREG